jgi:hypothetical protein
VLLNHAVKPSAILRLRATAAVNAARNQDTGNLWLILMDGTLEIFCIVSGFNGSLSAQTLLHGVDECLHICFACEIDRGSLRQLVTIHTSSVRSLGADIALPLMSNPMGCHPRLNAVPLPLNRDVTDRGVF